MRVAPEATTPVQRHPGHVQLNVGIPIDLDRRLRAFCNDRNTPMNAVVTRSLRRYLSACHESPPAVPEEPA